MTPAPAEGRARFDLSRLRPRSPRGWWVASAALALVAALAAIALAERGGSSSARFFAADSFWNAPLSDDAPLDPNSDALVVRLLEEVGEKPPWINTTEFSVPVYTVGPDQREITVRLTNRYREPAVLDAFASVPVPPDAKPAAGTDRHMVIWQPSTDTMWEFFDMQGSGEEWSAKIGARLDDVSAHPGVDPYPTGSTASGIPAAGGLILLDELERGRIDHGLALATRDVRSRFFTPPANRTDGFVDDPNVLPEGARLRLDPSLDLDSLDMPPATRMIAEAAQRYGLVLRDKSSGPTLYIEDPTPSGRQDVVDRFLEGRSPGEVMAAFPWDRLQVLEMNLRCCWNVRSADRTGT